MTDSGATAWILVATALVLFMTPGLAFFYGGLVRGKNVISTVMHSFVAMAVVSVIWVLWAYSLAFGSGGEFLGSLEFLGFKGVGAAPLDGQQIPHELFAIFQMMFAVITPALITGAFAERFKFTTYLVFLVLWVTLVYAPIAHWVWADDGRHTTPDSRHFRPALVGRGFIDYPTVLTLMNGSGYTGALSFEYEGPMNRADAAREGIAYLRSVLETL